MLTFSCVWWVGDAAADVGTMHSCISHALHLEVGDRTAGQWCVRTCVPHPPFSLSTPLSQCPFASSTNHPWLFAWHMYAFTPPPPTHTHTYRDKRSVRCADRSGTSSRTNEHARTPAHTHSHGRHTPTNHGSNIVRAGRRRNRTMHRRIELLLPPPPPSRTLSLSTQGSTFCSAIA
jgi:hypothetical protein